MLHGYCKVQNIPNFPDYVPNVSNAISTTEYSLIIQVTFEPALPEEVRGDQFETATPAHFGVGVDHQEELSVTHFDYTVVEVHTDGTPTEEQSAAPTTVIPHTPSHSPPSLTTAPGSALRGTPEPVAEGVSTCGDVEGSSGCGGDEETGVPPEGSAAGATPTPAADAQPSVRTDETEIGGTELPTDAPPRKTTTLPQTDSEGSASGEDEASGQDAEPAETASPLPPRYSTLYSQQPPRAAGAEVPGVPVVLPHVDAVTEAGSGAEQLSGQEEVSGETGGLIDLPRAVSVTVSPKAEAVTSRSSTRESPTRPSFVSPDDVKHEPTSPSAARPYSPQTDQSATTLKPPTSQETPSSSGHVTDSVPQGVLISEPTATPPSEGHVNEEVLPPLLQAQTQAPQEPVATKPPGSDTDVSLEASTVNIKGA